MRSGWTAFTNTGLRLLLCLPLLSIFVLFVPDDTLGKGGTNIHEGLRYRDPRTHKCRGPADFGN